MVPILKTGIIKLKTRKWSNKEVLFKLPSKDKKASRRGNERKIGEVVKLVLHWKELQGKIKQGDEKYSLETAAKEVGVPKKTLDDYLKQIQLGLANKFDFGYHRDSLMGILRHFNSQSKLTVSAAAANN